MKKITSTYRAICAIGLVAIAAVALDATVGSLPVEMLSFPLNILLLVLWAAAIGYLYRHRESSAVAQTLLTRGATWLSLALMAGLGVILGLQRQPATTSWVVVASLLFVLTHLSLVTLRGWRRNGGIRYRFVLTHIGLLLALGAGFWGAPDREQMRIAVSAEATNEAYTMEGEIRALPYDISLSSARTELSDSGVPTLYEATIRVEGEEQVVRVNHPYARTLSEKIYLISISNMVDGEQYAVLEIVHEPWQWLSATGIVMLIVGAILMFLRGAQQRRA